MPWTRNSYMLSVTGRWPKTPVTPTRGLRYKSKLGSTSRSSDENIFLDPNADCEDFCPLLSSQTIRGLKVRGDEELPLDQLSREESDMRLTAAPPVTRLYMAKMVHLNCTQPDKVQEKQVSEHGGKHEAGGGDHCYAMPPSFESDPQNDGDNEESVDTVVKAPGYTRYEDVTPPHEVTSVFHQDTVDDVSSSALDIQSSERVRTSVIQGTSSKTHDQIKTHVIASTKTDHSRKSENEPKSDSQHQGSLTASDQSRQKSQLSQENANITSNNADQDSHVQQNNGYTPSDSSEVNIEPQSNCPTIKPQGFYLTADEPMVETLLEPVIESEQSTSSASSVAMNKTPGSRETGSPMLSLPQLLSVRLPVITSETVAAKSPAFISPVVHQNDSSVNQFAPLGCLTQFPNTTLDLSSALICIFCGFPRLCVEELEAHIAWDHWKWTPFQCLYCPLVRRPTEYSLRLHLAEAHPDQPHTIVRDIDDQKSALLQQEVQNALQRLASFKANDSANFEKGPNSSTGRSCMNGCCQLPLISSSDADKEDGANSHGNLSEASSKYPEAPTSDTGRQRKLITEKEISCNLCSMKIVAKISKICQHIYSHLYGRGLGHRFQCRDCSFGSTLNSEMIKHCKLLHQNSKKKPQDRKSLLKNDFKKVKVVCFPGEVVTKRDKICAICKIYVSPHHIWRHLFRYHIKRKTMRCGYCDYSTYLGAILSCHYKASHPGKPVTTVDTSDNYKTEIEIWYEKCFGVVSID